MRVRVLYYLQRHPGYSIGKAYDMPPDVAKEYLDHGYGELVRTQAVETAVAPPAPERAVEREPQPEPPAATPPPDWPLKTKSPEEYIAEHGDKPEDELSPSVAANLEIARRIAGE